jgi:hypothetical protein
VEFSPTNAVAWIQTKSRQKPGQKSPSEEFNLDFKPDLPQRLKLTCGPGQTVYTSNSLRRDEEHYELRYTMS